MVFRDLLAVAIILRGGLAHRDIARARNIEASAKHIDGAAGFGRQRFLQSIQHRFIGIAAIQSGEFFPGLRLRGFNPAHHIFGVQSPHRVVMTIGAFHPAVIDQLFDDVGF